MSLVEQTEHRPWPLPKGPWLMTQTWYSLLFAHWVVPADALAARLPQGLQLDLYDGQAWVGIIPFGMQNVRLRGVIGFPTATKFLELNVRTYVKRDGKPGVWFFSLDAASAAAVFGARLFFHLPYYHARMRMVDEGGWIHYQSERTGARDGAAQWKARYRPTGQAVDGDLERWLTERYCLYAAAGNRIWRGEIHHRPWPLQVAEAEIEENSMLARVGIELPDTAPLVHYSERMDVLIWPPQRVVKDSRSD